MTFKTQPFVLLLNLSICLSHLSEVVLNICELPEYNLFFPYNIVIKNADVVPVPGKNSALLSECLTVFHLKKHSLIRGANEVQRCLSFLSI